MCTVHRECKRKGIDAFHVRDLNQSTHLTYLKDHFLVDLNPG
jgi:hypothetical protein